MATGWVSGLFDVWPFGGAPEETGEALFFVQEGTVQIYRISPEGKKFVIDNLREPVQMMVLSYERSLKVAQPFTSDSRAVTDADAAGS